MPEAKSPATELLTHYSSQPAQDLELNAQEQDQVRSEIESLQARLLTLQHDHTVLATMRQALESGIPLQQAPVSAPVRGYGLPTAPAPGAVRRKQKTPTLVARSTVQRLRQEHSVRYTSPEPNGPDEEGPR
ncbi:MULTISPECIES: hypothetical protein [Streptomyces]|uniref:Transposase n=1 Tax=Streptomyces canarius TaxID=285453 RepID=A0ABQ3D921_9ACTN|nr:hypothetical protein [Streptomyces canarius]GHA59159.1 hypothetical protein GCM10010345_74290 [Streptomyces canarius]